MTSENGKDFALSFLRNNDPHGRFSSTEIWFLNSSERNTSYALSIGRLLSRNLHLPLDVSLIAPSNSEDLRYTTNNICDTYTCHNIDFKPLVMVNNDSPAELMEYIEEQKLPVFNCDTQSLDDFLDSLTTVADSDPIYFYDPEHRNIEAPRIKSAMS